VPTQRKFTLFEKSPGRMSLTMIPSNLSAKEVRCGPSKDKPLIRRMDYAWTPMSTFLMRTLIRAPELGVVGLAPPEFYEIQLQKLAVNAVIGPLSVLYDCYNSELLSNYNVSRSMRMLINEISTILQRLPGVSRQAKIENRFNAERLEKIIVGVLGRTGKNSTNMLQAVRRGERTDIDFYNGYLLNRAAELRIHCPHLEMMVAMVKGKQAMRSKERNSFIPFKA
jgi:2-dehydropantoate 2-reductase